MKPERQGHPAMELKRGDWDFESCPPGRELYCWRYEYAREAPWIVDEYKLAQKCGRKVKFGWQCGFDEFGNWHFWRHGDGERGDDWGILLQIPAGFPVMPYLQTEHHIVEPKVTGIEMEPAFYESEEWLKKGFSDAGTWTKFRVGWDYSDQRLVHEFGNWLKPNRPRPPRQRRGNAERRGYLADLKALGAYRLLRSGMTAEKAQAHTKTFMPHGLYAKLPDWYEARSRAKYVLEEVFRYEDESIAGVILGEGACETCPERGRGCEPKA